MDNSPEPHPVEELLASIEYRMERQTTALHNIVEQQDSILESIRRMEKIVTEVVDNVQPTLDQLMKHPILAMMKGKGKKDDHS